MCMTLKNRYLKWQAIPVSCSYARGNVLKNKKVYISILIKVAGIPKTSICLEIM